MLPKFKLKAHIPRPGNVLDCVIKQLGAQYYSGPENRLSGLRLGHPGGSCAPGYEKVGDQVVAQLKFTGLKIHITPSLHPI